MGHGHGHGHGHGGHHHGGGGGGPVWGGGWGWGYPGGYDDGGDIVIVNPPSQDTSGALAYIMSLPKAQRPAAYAKIFGHQAAPGVLGDFTIAGISTTTLAVLGVAGYLLYHCFGKKK